MKQKIIAVIKDAQNQMASLSKVKGMAAKSQVRKNVIQDLKAINSFMKQTNNAELISQLDATRKIIANWLNSNVFRMKG